MIVYTLQRQRKKGYQHHLHLKLTNPTLKSMVAECNCPEFDEDHDGCLIEFYKYTGRLKDIITFSKMKKTKKISVMEEWVRNALGGELPKCVSEHFNAEIPDDPFDYSKLLAAQKEGSDPQAVISAPPSSSPSGSISNAFGFPAALKTPVPSLYPNGTSSTSKVGNGDQRHPVLGAGSSSKADHPHPTPQKPSHSKTPSVSSSRNGSAVEPATLQPGKRLALDQPEKASSQSSANARYRKTTAPPQSQASLSSAGAEKSSKKLKISEAPRPAATNPAPAISAKPLNFKISSSVTSSSSSAKPNISVNSELVKSMSGIERVKENTPGSSIEGSVERRDAPSNGRIAPHPSSSINEERLTSDDVENMDIDLYHDLPGVITAPFSPTPNLSTAYAGSASSPITLDDAEMEVDEKNVSVPTPSSQDIIADLQQDLKKEKETVEKLEGNNRKLMAQWQDQAKETKMENIRLEEKVVELEKEKEDLEQKIKRERKSEVAERNRLKADLDSSRKSIRDLERSLHESRRSGAERNNLANQREAQNERDQALERLAESERQRDQALDSLAEADRKVGKLERHLSNESEAGEVTLKERDRALESLAESEGKVAQQIQLIANLERRCSQAEMSLKTLKRDSWEGAGDSSFVKPEITSLTQTPLHQQQHPSFRRGSTVSSINSPHIEVEVEVEVLKFKLENEKVKLDNEKVKLESEKVKLGKEKMESMMNLIAHRSTLNDQGYSSEQIESWFPLPIINH